MISTAMLEAFKSFVPEENIKLDIPLKQYTTFRVGGPADCLIEIESTSQLVQLIEYLRVIESPYFILGNGSNLLVSDQGYSGVVLRIADKMSAVTVKENKMEIQAGAFMSKAAKIALENGLTGLEFASGIPGTIGGGIVMNAGAYGGEFSQIVESVSVIDKKGQIMTLDNETMEFGYRTSVVKKYGCVITSVCLKLAQEDPEKIKARMEELASLRKEKQPLTYPSAGSTFKRPEGNYAGKLIMEAGLKGLSVGDAQVSEKHCGFIINKGNAKASEIYELIQMVSDKVYDYANVRLEPEVILLGEFS